MVELVCYGYNSIKTGFSLLHGTTSLKYHKYTAYSIFKGYLAHFIGNLAIFPNINSFTHV